MQCNASTYPGPFARWQTIRRNYISGVALSSGVNHDGAKVCGTINASPLSTDVVVERNTFDCPIGTVQPPIVANCSHCKVWK